jgi:hypothetical protein
VVEKKMSGNVTSEETVPGMDELLKIVYLFLSKPEAGSLLSLFSK